MKELKIYTNYKYKNLLYDINKNFTFDYLQEYYIYSIENFFFDDNLKVQLKIKKNMRDFGNFYTTDFCFYLLASNPLLLNTIEEDKILFIKKFSYTKEDQLFTIKLILDFLDCINDYYIYDKYTDLILLKKNKTNELCKEITSELCKEITSELCKEIDIFRRDKPNDCGICMELITSSLKTSCCYQPICRLCVLKIQEPVKCPFCRKDFY